MSVHYRLYRMLADQNPAIAQYADRAKQILIQAAQNKKGFSEKENSFDEEGSILSNETREWIKKNLA